MKIKSSPLPLKIAILISTLIGVLAVIMTFIQISKLGITFSGDNSPMVGAMLVQYIILGILYLVMAFFLYKLVGGTSNREIICRKNLVSLKRILSVLVALILTKIIFSLIITSDVLGVNLRLTIFNKLMTIVCSSWELLMSSLVIYVLAAVFERAVILKEEEALTI
ncbi:hypothetical protein [Chitinophaga sp. RAB17]|uniref:hypothetical protein n=1 Tax=Chitinophaga sp. RAB17 TaxID=3233049 RepID=UPI003F90F178